MSDSKSFVYLDYAASTPVDPEILSYYLEATEQAWANPNSLHQAGQKAKAYLENSRLLCAQLLGCDRSEVIFTASATESNNLAIQGLLRAITNYELQITEESERVKELKSEKEKNQNSSSLLHSFTPSLQNGWFQGSPKAGVVAGAAAKPHILVSSIEHDSVLKLEESDLAEFEAVSVDSEGFIEVDELFAKVKDCTVLISIMLVNNEIGTIQPVKEVSQKLQALNIIRSQKGLSKIYLHCDAVQAVNYLPLNLEQLRVDLLTIGSQKIYAPKGAALLFIRKGTPIEPMFFGGGQEKDVRSGTPNVPAIYAFAKALEQCEKMRENEVLRLRELRDFLFRELKLECANLEINGFWQENLSFDEDKRIVNNVNFSLPKINAEALLTYLDLHGFCVSAGSGCHSGSLVQSGVVKALGKEVDGATVRVTLGRGTKQEELESLIVCLNNFG